MYDLKKRAYFTTLGELRMLLEDYPDEMPVFNCGCVDSWLHIDTKRKLISLDNESLSFDYYEDLEAQGISNSSELEELYDFKQRKEHDERLEALYYKRLALEQEMTLDYMDY